MRFFKAFPYGIFAGLAIGLGSLVFTLVTAYATDVWGAIFGSALFSIGLILVCTLGLHLYTGKVGVVFDGPNRKEIGELGYEFYTNQNYLYFWYADSYEYRNGYYYLIGYNRFTEDHYFTVFKDNSIIEDINEDVRVAEEHAWP